MPHASLTRAALLLGVGAAIACSDAAPATAPPAPGLPTAPTGGPPTAPAPAPAASRTYRMGFSAIPPRLGDAQLLMRTVDAWLPRADGAIFQTDVPWAELLSGGTAVAHVRREIVPLVEYYRAKGLPVVVAIDPLNAGARDKEAFPLIAAARSVREPQIQALYRTYMVAVAREARPDHLVMALETNLVRSVAPREVYDALVTMTNAAAADIRAAGLATPLGVSFQVENAWGLLPRLTLAASPQFRGTATDRASFPFMEFVGLSAYPHIGGFTAPAEVPADYYARMRGSPALPVMVVEGGWSSSDGAYWASSQDVQRRWMSRQAALLDSARATGVYQLNFTDLDPAGYPVPPGVDLTPFHRIGLVDVSLRAKPAALAWDSVFARPRR